MALPLTGLGFDQLNSDQLNYNNASSAKQDNSSMPCHQVSVDKLSNFCPETGISTCDCCEFSVPAALSIHNGNPERVLFVIAVNHEKFSSG